MDIPNNVIGQGEDWKEIQVSPQAHRFEFVTGEWWIIRAYLSVGLEREWMPIALQAMATDEEGQIQINLEDPDIARKIHHVNDLVVLKSTTSWSYGELNQATLESSIPDWQYRVVIRRLTELYRPLLERSIRDWLSDSSSLLNEKSPFPASS